MLFQLILLVYGRAIDLGSLGILREFEAQCHPKWSFVDSPFKLSQLIVVFRHGSRAPLKDTGPQWKDRKCSVCSTECRTVGCQDGMLTLEGFNQSKELGRFISRFYFSRFSDLQEVQGFYSKIGRTFSTLNGVIQGMGLQDTKARMEGSLINNPNSVHVKSILINSGSMGVEKSGEGNYYVYDNVVTSLCSGTPFDCSKFSCRPEKIYDLMRRQENQFIESVEKTRTNLTANGISLGKFGSFLEEIIFNRNSIVLVSGHDSTLIKLLIGLGIKLAKIPAYASAVFLEVWRQADGAEYVRVVYEGEVQKIGLYKEEYVEAEKFRTYLAMFNRLNDALDCSTGINSKSMNPSHKINEMAQSATNVYKPLLTELKNRDIIQDSSLVGENAAECQHNIFGNFLNGLIVPVRQFLFGGWFGGSKKDAKNSKIEVDVEAKDKDTSEKMYRTLECDKDGKSNCRVIPDISKRNESKNNKVEIRVETNDRDTGEKKHQVIECDKNGGGNCRTISNADIGSRNKADVSSKLDRSNQKSQESTCEISKPPKREEEKEVCGCKKKDKCKRQSPSCQVKEMLERSCSTEEPQCEAVNDTCNFKPSSAFDGEPGICRTFPNTCEASPPACFRTQSQPPVLSDGRCRSPIPGVEILE